MAIRAKRLGVLSAVSAGILIPELFLLPQVLDNRKDCERAGDWVTAHASELPNTLVELSSFPRAYRTAIFSAVSDNVKASLFRDQMARQLRENHTLSSAERGLLARGIELIQPEIYEQIRETGRLPSDVAALAEEAKTVFSRENAWILQMIGGPQLGPITRQSAGVLVVETMRSFLSSFQVAVSAAPQGPLSCSCSTMDDTWNHCWVHFGPWSCQMPSNGCAGQGSGCGFWGSTPCDGMCCSNGVCIS